MAPYPEEVDVFTVPHSRMKNLVNDYADMIKKTNFTNDLDLTLLLESLLRTFMEFKTHEQIENQFIMNKLKHKLKQLSIKNTAVCNCHKDDQLGQMMNFIKAGYKKKTAQDRINFGLKLEKALEDFTCTFIPHMQEEEEVFQPLLLQYFSYEELRELKQKVIQQHIAKEQEKNLVLGDRGVPDGAAKHSSKAEEKSEENEVEDYCKYVSTDFSSPEAKDIDHMQQSPEKSEGERKDNSKKDEICPLDILPVEIKLRIFSYLKPPDLCRSAQVSAEWSDLAMDPALWSDLYPVHWAQGNWNVSDETEKDDCSNESDNSEDDNYMVIDDDADIDESERSENVECGNIIQQVKREAEMLRGLMKHLLPKSGKGVKKLVLKNSRALTNGLLNRMIQYCPNLEHLDVSQTRTSDAGLKRIGKNGCGKRLKHIVLSGCVNITDATLVRIAVAQHQSATVSMVKPCGHTSQVNLKSSQQKRSRETTDDNKQQEENITSNENQPERGKFHKQNVLEMTQIGVTEKRSINPYDVNAADVVKRHGDQYDLDCLCKFYYNECHVAIEGGCDMSNHHCSKSAFEGVVSSAEGPPKCERKNDVYICKNGCVHENKESPFDRNDEAVDNNSSDYEKANRNFERDFGKDTILRYPKAPDDITLYTAGYTNKLVCNKDAKDEKNVAVATASVNGSDVENLHQAVTAPPPTPNTCHACCFGKEDFTVNAIEDCIPVLSTDSVPKPLPAKYFGVDMLKHCDEKYTSDFDASDIGFNAKLNCSQLAYDLECLNLSGCFQITDIGLSALGKIGVFPNLKELDLSGCLRISADGIHAMVNSCPNLQPQQLYYCDNIIDGPFADTASGCQNLECNSRVCCRSGE